MQLLKRDKEKFVCDTDTHIGPLLAPVDMTVTTAWYKDYSHAEPNNCIPSSTKLGHRQQRNVPGGHQKHSWSLLMRPCVGTVPSSQQHCQVDQHLQELRASQLTLHNVNIGASVVAPWSGS